ncbi:MAG: hypothetical protein VB130_13565 [Clostridium sp.]|nr:hypothetical protein [Clostridium sp.]
MFENEEILIPYIKESAFLLNRIINNVDFLNDKFRSITACK